MAKMVFQRFEKKFLLGENQVAQLLPAISEFLELDPYCKKKKNGNIPSTIFTLTPTRVPSFGIPSIILIIKKSCGCAAIDPLRVRRIGSFWKSRKIGGVVAKRRVVLTHREAQAFSARPNLAGFGLAHNRANLRRIGLLFASARRPTDSLHQL